MFQCERNKKSNQNNKNHTLGGIKMKEVTQILHVYELKIGFLSLYFSDIQQLKSTFRMIHQVNQDIFNVLDLGESNSWSNNLTYHPKDINFDFEEYYDHLQDAKQKIQELPATNETEDANFEEHIQDQDFLSENNDQNTKNSLDQTHFETFQPEIQFSQHKCKQRNIAYSGYDYETQNLGKNLKFSTTSYLNMLIKAKYLESQEQDAAKVFTSSNGSLQNFRRLFQLQTLSQKCREYYQSQSFVQNIMSSSKMDLRSKLTMLRHLQKFRKMTFKQQQNWKLECS